MQIAWQMAWQRVGTTEAVRKLWSRIAYATRYGRIALTEAVRLDQTQLSRYLEALSEIVKSENGPSGLREK